MTEEELTRLEIVYGDSDQIVHDRDTVLALLAEVRRLNEYSNSLYRIGMESTGALVGKYMALEEWTRTIPTYEIRQCVDCTIHQFGPHSFVMKVDKWLRDEHETENEGESSL